MKWIAAHATEPLLNADPKAGFIMGGISAGGALTAAYSRLFQEEPLAYPLTGQWLCIPSMMDASTVPEKYKESFLSTTQQAKNKTFSEETRKWLNTMVEADFTSPLRYAINARTPLSGQPKTYFQVDGADPLRDDALIYDEMLEEAGIETKVDLYKGCPHGHFSSFLGLDITNKANIDTIVGFGWLLGKEVSREEVARQLGL
jgi:acetyl esterase/lipase